MMKKTTTLAAIAALSALGTAANGQVGVERKLLERTNLDIAGFELVLAEVTIAVGGREGRHYHSGMLVGQVIQGELTLELEGQATRVYRAGESILVRPGQIHEGVNTGDVPVIAVATFVAPLGEALTTQVD